MPLAAITDLRRFNWGKETTPGTLVPATSQIIVSNIDFEPTDRVYHPELTRGLIQRYKGQDFVIERGMKFAVPDSIFPYEQAPNWASMSISNNGNTPTGTGPYVYTYTRDPTVDPTPTTWTFERRLSDGANYIDHEWGYALLGRIGWKGSQNAPIMFSADGFGRRAQASVHTPALTAPAMQMALSSSSKVYINDSWAAVGTTQVVGQILGWEIDFMTGMAPIFTTDGRADLDYGGVVVSSANTQLKVKITMLVKGTASQWLTEQTAAEAATLRAVRIQADGSDVSRQIQWDMLLKHDLGSLYKVGEFEGQEIVEMNLVECTDGTNLFRMKITNNVAAMV